MASDDTTLIEEVRALTQYPDSIISPTDATSLVTIAKREIQAEFNNEQLSFYDNLNAERALFWLSCLFFKIHTGELDGPALEISELRIEQTNFDTSMQFWLRRFETRLRAVSDESVGFGHVRVARSDRTYQFDN